jgi:ribonuclease HII
MAEARISLADIRRRYVDKGRPLPLAMEKELLSDPRPSARAILEAVNRRRRDNRSEGQRLRTMLRFERELWDRGVAHVAGIDEAGMSPLAGPVSAAAVIFPPGFRLPGVDDSKKLDPRERERLAPLIKKGALAFSVVLIEPDEIDRLNIYWAGILAMRRAVENLGIAPGYLLIDGRRIKELPIAQRRIDHGDEKSLTIAAASILAKTTRDARMAELDRVYPRYGFAQHKGYPVREHVAALSQHGACPIHRLSFAPVRRVLGLPPLPPWPPRLSTTELRPLDDEVAAPEETAVVAAATADTPSDVSAD